MKHADAPERFLDSEVDLDEAIQQLMGMAGLPDLYTEIAGQHVVPTILALLQHDNSDIAADAIQLLKELTDADARNDAVCGLLLVPNLACRSSSSSSMPADLA